MKIINFQNLEEFIIKKDVINQILWKSIGDIKANSVGNHWYPELVYL